MACSLGKYVKHWQRWDTAGLQVFISKELYDWMLHQRSYHLTYPFLASSPANIAPFPRPGRPPFLAAQHPGPTFMHGLFHLRGDGDNVDPAFVIPLCHQALYPLTCSDVEPVAVALDILLHELGDLYLYRDWGPAIPATFIDGF